MCSFRSCQTRFEFLSQFRKVRNAFECFITQVQTRLPKTKCVWPMKINVICTVCTIIRNRKRQKLPTYACFVDISQAFDSIKHNLLWFKLVHHGVRGKFYHILRSLYSSIECSVRVPGLGNTDWFSVLCGVRQGDNLSPTLFALYVNDLIQEIKGLNAGIQIDEHNISVLAYADDLVLIANTEQDLQRMLDVTANWCVKWCIRINLEKKLGLCTLDRKAKNAHNISSICMIRPSTTQKGTATWALI